MPTILLKKSDTPGSVPNTSQITNLSGGVEVAVNTADKRMFTMNSSSAVVELGTNPSSLSIANNASINILTATTATITTLSVGSLNLTSFSLASANITTLTGSSANITTATHASANITTLNSASANITTLGSSSANITTLTGTNFSATSLTLTNALRIAEGGTGLDSTPTNGQLLIGNGTGFSLSTLTAGSNITITNNAGSITINATGGGGGGVTAVTASSPLASSGGTAPNISIASSTGSGAVVLADNPAISSATITNLNVSTSATISRFNAGSSTISNLFASGNIFVSGSVGIGTTSPTYKLDIQDSGNTLARVGGSGTGQAGLYIASGGALNPFLNFLSSGSTVKASIIAEASTGSLIFTSNGETERARISAAGNLLVNSTSGTDSKFIVQGSGTSSAAYAAIISDSNGNTILFGRNDGLINTGTRTNSPYNFVVGGTNRDLFVDSGGDIGYVSSIRASKTNINPISNTDWLLQLNPVAFNYRKKDKDGNYTDEIDGPVKHGLIAEEVEKVNPDLCFYDDEENGGTLRGVNYSHLITPMLKLIQKQQAAISLLEAKVSALENK